MRTSIHTTILASILSAVLCNIAWAAGATPDPVEVSVQRELAERELASHLASVNSAEALATYRSRIPQDSPLRALPAGARERFLDSLRFTERGLASFNYADLRAELTASQVHAVLAVFGAQHSTAAIPGLRVETPADASVVALGAPDVRPVTDYNNYLCAGPGTCSRSESDICIGANCSKP